MAVLAEVMTKMISGHRKTLLTTYVLRKTMVSQEVFVCYPFGLLAPILVGDRRAVRPCF
jgi:hypothetical protein